MQPLLPSAILSDPAFSSDPRAHPHFPLPFLPLPPPPPIPSTRLTPSVHKHKSTTTHRRSSMKALVRRFTNRHNLDRIDELDETDPFGTSYHHDGPYEAIGTHVTTTHANREFAPRPLQPALHQSTRCVPSIHGQEGLSLHLQPGQILQHNTVYTSHAASMNSVPHPFPRQSSTAPVRPEHARNRSLPDTRSRPPTDASPHLLGDLQNRPSSFPRPPLQRHLRDNMPGPPNTHHGRHVAPYVLDQSEITVLPPPRYESRLYNSAPSRSPQRTPPPSVNSASRKQHTIESTIIALPSHDSRDKSIHSLDSSSTTSSTLTHSSSGSQNKSLDAPRTRHVPKRLVMPSPLQPDPPQPQFNFSPAHSIALQGDYPDELALEDAKFEEKPAMYAHGPKLLRKRSSAFPEKAPLPHLVPMPVDDAVSITGNTPSKVAYEAEGTKEKIRRRRLSKRKNDI